MGESYKDRESLEREKNEGEGLRWQSEGGREGERE